MLEITQRPQRSHAASLSMLSKWNCSYLPIIFLLQRKDITIISVDPNSGSIDVRVPDNAVAASVQVGDIIYVQSGVAYNGYGEVLAISGGSGSDYIFNVDIPDTINTLGGWVNLNNRQGYHVEVMIKGWNRTPGISGVGSYETFATLRLSPDGTGLIRCNVGKDPQGAGFLNKYVVHYNDTLLQRNELNRNAGSWFYIETLEKWIGSAETIYSDSSNLSYFVPAVKQLLQLYGNNLAEYVPFNDVLSVAKFLTDGVPTYWPGYPFDIAFIYSEQIEGYDLTVEQDYIDVTGTITGHIDADIDTSEHTGVNRLAIIGQLATDTPIPAGTTELSVWLELGSVALLDYVEEGYVDPGYTETDPLVAPPPITPFRITEKLRIKVADACTGQPYIRWQGTKGNTNYQLFNKRYTNDSKPSIEGMRGVYVEDVETAYANEQVLKMNDTERMIVTCRVPLEDLARIKTINRSGVSIQLWIPATDQWLNLIIDPKGFKYRSDQSMVNIECTFMLPSQNTINL